MKNTLLCTIMFFSFIISAVAGQRVSLVEHFTSAVCGPCAVQNPIVDPIYARNTDKIVLLKYQVNLQGAVDPMCQENPVDVNARAASFYGVTGVPTGFINGNYKSGAPSTIMTDANFNSASSISSDWEINLDYSLDPTNTNITVTMKVKSLVAQSSSTLKAQIVLVENEVNYYFVPGTNGEKTFGHVMRKMVPNATGTTLKTTWTAGEESTIEYTIPVPTYYKNLGELSVIAFIQDTSNKNVKQAAYAAPKPIVGNMDIAIPQLYPVSSNQPTPKVILKNNGNQSLTSAVFTLNLLNKTTKTMNWTGNIPAGGSEEVALTDFTLNNGLTVAYISVNKPNGKLDTKLDDNSQYLACPKFHAPSALPIFEDFESSYLSKSIIFNHSLGSAYGIYQYSATVGLGANGSSYSLLLRSYNNPVMGDKYDYYLPTFSLAGQPNAQLTFHYAYCPYGGWPSTDSLCVEITKDGGSTWDLLYKNGGQDLNTSRDSTNYVGEFLPLNAYDWKKKDISLSPYAGNENVIIRFRMVSNYGNTLALDQLKVSALSTAIVNPSIVTEDVNVYPNPAREITNVSFTLNQSTEVGAKLYDLSGKIVLSKDWGILSQGSHKEILSLSTVQSGDYVLVIRANGKTVSKRLIVSK